MVSNVTSLVFAALFCGFANYELSQRVPGWSTALWKQGIVCLTITAVYLLWSRRLVIASQIVFVAALIALFAYNTIEQRKEPLLVLLATILALLIYGLAEGFEIAFTKLQAKELDQFPEPKRKLLANLKDNHEVFLDAREWLVIALVIGLTLASDFERLDFPAALGISFQGSWARLAFSLLFTTVIVVWTVQGPGKALAWENPLRFLDFCGWLWRPLLLFGKWMKSAQVFEPGARLERRLRAWLPGFEELPNLRPSEQAFFCAGVKRYGYALYKLYDDFDVSSDGSTKMTQTGLFYVVGGGRTHFDRFYDFDEPIIPTFRGDPMEYKIETYVLPNFGDEIDSDLAASLEELFEGNLQPSRDNVFRRQFGVKARCQFDVADNVTNPKRAHLVIESPKPLPEGVAALDQAVAIRFEVQLKIDANGFRTPPGPADRPADRFFRSFSFPCGHSRTRILLNESTGTIQFANVRYEAILHGSPHPIETSRIIRQNTEGKEIILEPLYPLPGVTDQVSWEVWPD